MQVHDFTVWCFAKVQVVQDPRFLAIEARLSRPGFRELVTERFIHLPIMLWSAPPTLRWLHITTMAAVSPKATSCLACQVLDACFGASAQASCVLSHQCGVHACCSNQHPALCAAHRAAGGDCGHPGRVDGQDQRRKPRQHQPQVWLSPSAAALSLLRCPLPASMIGVAAVLDSAVHRQHAHPRHLPCSSAMSLACRLRLAGAGNLTWWPTVSRPFLL